MSRKKSRMQSVREAKDKRAKKLAVGGVVLLAAVLAFEMPHVLKKGGSAGSSPPPAATTATYSGVAPAPATTAPGTAAAAVAPVASTKLPNSDLAPRRLKSQLYSFSHFAGKDPFVQQVSAASITNSPSTGAGTSSAQSGNGGGGSTTSAPAPARTYNRTLAQTGAVTMQVNGKVQTVRVGASFPSSNPLFSLVSVVHGIARIGIANGSYASGAPTVSLVVGRTLTLVDTADGIRYKVRLLSAS
jgi:hypothetical protein